MLKMLKDKKIRQQIFVYSLSGIIIGFVLLFILKIPVVLDIVSNFISILSPFIWGLVFAFILSKFAILLESKLPSKMNFKLKRFLSSLISVLLLILIVVIFALIVSPQIGDSIASISNVIVNFSNNAPTWIKNAQKQSFLPKDVIELLYEYSNTLISNIWTFIKTSIPNLVNFTIDTVNGMLNFVIGFIVAIYLLMDRENIVAKGRKVFKAFLNDKAYKEATVIYNLSISRFYRFFEGKLLDSLIIGIICFILMLILNLEYPVLISLIVGITNIIPFFGPFIGAIPSSLILLMVNPGHCLIFVIMILILQQIDGNIIGPRILGDSVGLSSLWIIFAIIVGGAYFGFFGMLLGVPVFSVIYYIFSKEVDKRLKNKKGKTK